MREPRDVEDLNVGDRVHTPARTISVTDRVSFGALTGRRPATALRHG
jgi:hypothetical protein